MGLETGLDIAEISARARAFHDRLRTLKDQLGPQTFEWYRWGSLGNFAVLDTLLAGTNRRLLELAGGRPIADIGGADGDVSLFLESLGYAVDFIDNPPTNMNGMRAVRTLASAMSSSIQIHEMDLDQQFHLPRSDYGLVLLLGILYHLKNPFYCLEALSKATRYCVLSTKVARMTSDKSVRIEPLPIAYLLDDRECNNDATNFWVFSETGLRRILKRTGWDLLDYISTGNRVDSDPASIGDGDERAFCLLQSRNSR